MPDQENDAASELKGPAEAKVPGAKPLSLVLRSRYWDWAVTELGAQRNETVAVPLSEQVILAAASGAAAPQGTKVRVAETPQPAAVRSLRRQKWGRPG